jgi:hypothetical protein
MSVRFRLVLIVIGVLVLLLPLASVLAGDIFVPPDDGGKPTCTPTEPAAPPPPAATCTTPSLLVNSRRIRLQYKISDVGPSGVSSVELWATRDGKTWQRYSNEPPPDGPLVVCVAEEGKYGFSIVVKNGLGLAGPVPQTGDTPQLWVEVDETKPAVHLLDCQVMHKKGARMVVSWTASDPNLTDTPVTISTASSSDGPWTPIATDVPNTGKYVWQMPSDVPYEVYVRVEARDRAGNVGSDHTARPVHVDMVRPRGTILGIANTRVETHSQAPKTDQEQPFNFFVSFTR